MLRKLMKYEWLSTSRMMFPFYILILSVSIINGAYFRIDQTDSVFHDIITTILQGVYTIIIVASFLFVIYGTLHRFYQNIYGKEGYLYHTLPVKSWENIVSKLCISVVWLIGTVIVLGTGLSVLGLIVYPEEFIKMYRSIALYWPILVETISLKQVFFFSLEMIICVILGAILFYLKAYGAMGVGQIVTNHRILVSVLFYIIFQVIENSIIFTTMSVTNLFDFFGDSTGVIEIIRGFHGLFFVYMLYVIVLSTIYFLITKYSVDKKLNL